MPPKAWATLTVLGSVQNDTLCATLLSPPQELLVLKGQEEAQSLSELRKAHTEVEGELTLAKQKAGEMQVGVSQSKLVPRSFGNINSFAWPFELCRGFQQEFDNFYLVWPA